jgi:hypothetical protein
VSRRRLRRAARSTSPASFDGIFFEGREGVPAFRPLPLPTDEEVGGVLARIAARVQRLLRRRGRDPWETDGVQADPLVQESPALASLSSASVQGRIALGPRAGAQVWRLGDEPEAPWAAVTGAGGTIGFVRLRRREHSPWRLGEGDALDHPPLRPPRAPAAASSVNERPERRGNPYRSPRLWSHVDRPTFPLPTAATFGTGTGARTTRVVM